MIRDLDEAPSDELSGYDLCVIGTGPAGVTLVHELAGSGLRIAVLESGTERRTRHADALRRVTSSGIAIKENSRERILGGASTTWSGLSSPMDPVDLGHREYLRVPGWPLGEDELAADYARAAERYRFPPLELFESGGFATLRDEGQLAPHWEELDEKVFLAADDPQNFGTEWRGAFERDEVDLWLGASVVRLEHDADATASSPRPDSDAGRDAGRARVVHSARTRSAGGRDVRVRARAFVVATGGLENARLLLLSELGNEHDQVGRHLMNHPKNYHGILHLAREAGDLPYFFGCLRGGFAGYAGLRLPLDVQRERGLLNSYVRLEPLFPWSDNDGVTSLVVLVKNSKALLTRWKRGRADEVVVLRDYAETGDDNELQDRGRSLLGLVGLALRVLAHLPSVASYAYYRLTRKAAPIRRVRIRNFMEMEPHPDNRVTLSDERDVNGTRVAHVHHACTELDRRSLIELHDALERDFARAGLGRFETSLRTAEPWPIDQDASHHMGTTRMGTAPEHSVVDPTLRVHQTTNLYMAGASVFPTSGCVNPTFTIVALSIRLARELRERLAPEATKPGDES